MVRLQPPQLASLDAWITEHESDMTRPEAIRKLIDLGLSVGSTNCRGTRSGVPKRKLR